MKILNKAIRMDVMLLHLSDCEIETLCLVETGHANELYDCVPFHFFLFSK
jgi:hypothetical protein